MAIGVGGHVPITPGINFPVNGAVPGHEFVELILVMNANHTDGLYPAENATFTAASGEGEIGLVIEGVAVEPKPFLRKSAAPVLFAVGGSVGEAVAIAFPVDPACG